jgi:predicted nucleic acid-binding protein
MSDKYFLDTNVFVYSFDDSAPDKKARALSLIRAALNTGSGIISTQVIQEFLNVALRKFAVPMTVEDGKTYVRQVLNPLCEIYPDLSLYETCLDIKAETGFSFYDSLIVTGAIKGECTILYSEDMQVGRVIRGVKIVNPFSVP